MLGVLRSASMGASLLIAACFLASTAQTCSAAYKIQRLAEGLDLPVHVTQAPGDRTSIYVVEQQTNDFLDQRSSGQITKIDLATGAKTSFLRVQDIFKATEGGLHTLAFHPDFETNGKFYLSWMANPKMGSTLPQLRLDEYQIQSGVPTFSRKLMDFTNLEAFGSHGINWVGFQPGATGSERDYLYVTTGDGGLQATDANFTKVSQDLNSILGKVLRIDVSAGDAYPADDSRDYGFPATNPYAGDGDSNTLGEVFHSGFRNPWRASFDRQTGDFFVGDVGFMTTEEISFAKAGQAGLDFGWSLREGTVETPVVGVGGEQGSSLNPIFELAHNADKGIVNVGSITGGYVYRGPIEELQGQYIFTDAKARELLSGTFDRETDPANFDGDNLAEYTIRTDEFVEAIEGPGELDVVVSFGEDADGHLYLVDLSIGLFANRLDAGEIYRLIPDLPADFNDDGFVNAADLMKWESDYGPSDGSDSDGDGDSDGADFLAWQRGMKTASAGSGLGSTVPEPVSIGLLATALTILASGRRASR